MIDVNSIDWNAAWKKPGEEEEGRQGCMSCGKRWSDPDRCRKFSESMKENNYAGSQSRIMGMDISREARVLDVGAGPGTLVIPLARIAREVTAVEPSGAMISCMKENIAEANLHNITIVGKKWEDVDIERDLTAPYDVVVASYSLGFPDLREGLQKMHDSSRDYVYIFWFADMNSPWQRNYGEIWEQLYGYPRHPGTRPNIIYNLLHQMGIYPNVQVTWEDTSIRFKDLEEAVTDQGAGLNLSTPEQIAVLREYLSSRLVHEQDAWYLKGRSPRAKIWWRKEDGS